VIPHAVRERGAQAAQQGGARPHATLYPHSRAHLLPPPPSPHDASHAQDITPILTAARPTRLRAAGYLSLTDPPPPSSPRNTSHIHTGTHTGTHTHTHIRTQIHKHTQNTHAHTHTTPCSHVKRDAFHGWRARVSAAYVLDYQLQRVFRRVGSLVPPLPFLLSVRVCVCACECVCVCACVWVCVRRSAACLQQGLYHAPSLRRFGCSTCADPGQPHGTWPFFLNC